MPNCQESRTQLLARSIKDVLSESMRLHWAHSGAQLSDALTKVMESQFLRETIPQGHYCLHDANEVLKNRANARNRIKWLTNKVFGECERAHFPIKSFLLPGWIGQLNLRASCPQGS